MTSHRQQKHGYMQSNSVDIEIIIVWEIVSNAMLTLPISLNQWLDKATSKDIGLSCWEKDQWRQSTCTGSTPIDLGSKELKVTPLSKLNPGMKWSLDAVSIWSQGLSCCVFLWVLQTCPWTPLEGRRLIFSLKSCEEKMILQWFSGVFNGVLRWYKRRKRYKVEFWQSTMFFFLMAVLRIDASHTSS